MVSNFHKKTGVALLLGCTVLLPCKGQSLVKLNQVSDPSGIINKTSDEETGTEVSSLVAPLEASGQHFVEWQLGGVRQQDALGVSVTSFSFTILEETTITAIYLPSDQDTDGDGVLDWFERTYHSNLDQSASADTDGDGFTLLEEQQRGYHPKNFDELSEGGVSRRQSVLTTLNLAGYPQYHWTSVPLGIVDITDYEPNGTEITTPDLNGQVSNGYQFAYWTVNGVVQSADDGRAMSQLNFTLTEDLAAIAHFVPQAEDSDADQIPDLYEWSYFSDLNENALSDSDGDGWTLAEEFARGYHPLRDDTLIEGGISRRRSVSLDVNLAGFNSYHWLSSPKGIIDQNGTNAEGTVVTTPDLRGASASDYRFAYWDVGGVPQAKSNGQALGELEIALDSDVIATAVYLLEAEDSDGDSIPDWYEWNYYTGLGQDEWSDSDGDGLTLSEEIARGYHPLNKDTLVEGGVSRRQSGPLSINLQPFERMEFVPLDGDLAKVFSRRPNIITGSDYGTNAHPLLGDWDGDGDLDVFVLHEDGCSVYENIGSVYYMQLVDRSAAFGSLSSIVAAIKRPTGALTDVNQDGAADLALGGSRGTVEIFLSNGDFASEPIGADVSFDTGATRVAPALGEFSGDALNDLVLLMDDGKVRLHHGTGTVGSLFTEKADNANLLPAEISDGISISSAQINGDELTDLLVSGSLGRLWEFHAIEPGTFRLISKVWGGASAGFANGLTISAGDLNADGDDDALGGTANGALVGLIDPRVGAPAGLSATGGADSIWLTWEPNRQARILGYNVYRSPGGQQPMLIMTDPYLRNPEYVDNAPLQPFSSYYVTGLTGRRVPGNTALDLVESQPSEIVTESSGEVTLTLNPSSAKAGHVASVLLSIDNAMRIRGQGLEIRLTYDAAKMTPASQDDPLMDTVWKTGLSQSLAVSDNGAATTGELVIMGSGGVLKPGQGKLFNLRFVLDDDVTDGEEVVIQVESAQLYDSSGLPVTVDVVNQGGLVVAQGFGGGDMDGDGVLDHDDKKIIVDLMRKNSREPTAQELRAGDLNGDGDITPQDLVIFIRLQQGYEPDKEFNP